MSIGERIIELRNQNGLSQYQLSKLMNVSRQAVSKWESDQSSPDTLNLIHLAEILDTDIEYLATGRRNFARRPPIVVESVKTVEKIVEKPVVKYVEKYIEKPVEIIVEIPTVEYVEKPVFRKVFRTKYIRNPFEIIGISIIAFILGLIIGILI